MNKRWPHSRHHQRRCGS